MTYEEPIQTKDFSFVQRTLKEYSSAPLSNTASWTGFPKWGTLVQLIQDFPFAPNKFSRPAYTCAQTATQFRNWAQSQIYGLCFGIATGDTTPEDSTGGGHVWNWTICDGKLVFVDYRGTMPAYAVPHTLYWVMEAKLIREFRKVDGWYL
jgi:hypothetical protein